MVPHIHFLRKHLNKSSNQKTLQLIYQDPQTAPEASIAKRRLN